MILAGGKGERFWPLSRSDRPKQFLKLTSDKIMLDETIERVRPLIPVERMMIVTGESMRAIILDTISYVGDENILTEPVGRNTCVAIGVAAVHLMKKDPDAVMVILSADHLIRPPEKLLQILEEGCKIAQSEDKLLTIGIVPIRPETAYGYIKQGKKYEHAGQYTVYEVEAFTEKPRIEMAHDYYYSRQHLWNSGMFIWSARSILSAIESCHGELYEQLTEYRKSIGTGSEKEARRQLYDRATAISIDYAVLENADNVLAIKADIVWDDVGGWRALDRYKDRDNDGNVVVGEAALLDTYETTVHNESGGLVACFGVSDLVIVRSGDITMVTHKTRVDDMKQLLSRLRDDDKTQKYL